MLLSKRLIPSILTIALLTSTITPALALEPNEIKDPLPGTGHSNLTLEVKDTSGGGGGDVDPTDIIVVTVPVELPIIMDLDGNVTVPSEAKIINHSKDKGVAVTEIKAILESGWSIADYSDDFSIKADDTKEIGLSLRGDKFDNSGTVTLTQDNWNIAKNGELPLNMGAKLPKQTQVSKTKIASIGFTVGWSGLDGDNGGSDPDAGKDTTSQLSVIYDNGLMLPGSINTATFKWGATENLELADVVSDNNAVADIQQTDATAEFSGEKQVVVEAKAKGEATITGKLSTGETASFKVVVSELSGDKTPSGEVSPDLADGDTLKPGDITVTVPVVKPDGNTEDIVITPDKLPDEPLKPGDNNITVEVDINGVKVTININITIASNNPSNGTTQTVTDAQAMGLTFTPYETGLEITAFENKQFKSELNIPEQIGDFKVLKIGNNAFQNQSNLKRVSIPDTVTQIGVNAFSGCTSMTDFTMSSNIQFIGGSAFKDCSSLQKIDMYDTITSINTNAFLGCTSLDKLDLSWVYPGTMNYSPFGLSREQIIYAPAESWDTYPMSISELNRNIEFDGTDSLEFKSRYIAGDIVLPSSVNGKKITNIAKIGWLSLPDVTSIDVHTRITETSNLFRSFTDAKSIKIPDSVTKITMNSFSGNKKVTEIVIPDSVTTIEYAAFEECIGLTNLVIPDTVTTIESGAFLNVPHITYNGTATGSPWGALAVN